MPNEQRQPLTRNLPRVAQKKVKQAFDKLGVPLPCHVVSVQWPFVTVNFDLENAVLPPVQVPLVTWQYIGIPIQVGEKGWVMPRSLYMGGINGMGPANKLANVNEPQANLSALTFVPESNTNWAQPGNINALTLWGPQGVVIQDKTGNAPDFSVTVNSSGVTIASSSGPSIAMTSSAITLSAGGHTVELNSSGILMDGHPYANHEHQPGTYVAGSTAVTGDSGIVVPGT